MSRIVMLVAIAAGFVLSTTADADEKPPAWKPQFVSQAPKDKLKAAFPKGATMTGEVTLACVAAAGGKLADCKVMKETPVGQGFGEAALAMVAYEKIKPKDEAGASVVGRPVRTSFTFLAPGDADPNWLKKPTGQEIANVFPRKAIDRGVGGRAVIECQVTVEGFLHACKVESESPAGLDFGAAGLQLTPQFRMTPMIRAGKPAPGGEVTIPIVWQPPTGGVMNTSTPVVLDPPWTRAPTQAEVNAAWPKAAAGLESGQAALRCDLDMSGQPKNCQVISENPRDKGFGKAAKALSKSFQVTFDPDDAKALKKYTVDVPFRFRDPARPDGRKLTRPRWVQTLSADGMALVYPKAATDAGVHAGKGAVACVVSAEGRLVDCVVAREAPTGLGFGNAALQAAEHMRMNPWTKEGDPAEGLKLTIPFDFTLSGSEPPPAKPAGP